MKLLYLFDPGSGVCLWAADDEARKAFGYPVELKQLPLSPEVLGLGQQLIVRFDTSIDWKYPPNPSLWSSVERESFRVASQQFYKRLVSELGTRFEIADETHA
jgi:hypothetical protein